LGLNASCGDQIRLEKKFITNKVVLDEATNKISFPIEHMGEMHSFSIEQIIALFLVKLKEFYDVAGISTLDGIVFTIPSYASNVERQSLYDAIEIAGLKCPRIINESTAIALNYGFFKRKDFDKEKPKTVFFVDFGHCKTTVTIATFSPDKVKIVCHHSDRNMGGRDFDYIIMQKLGGEFEKKFGCDPREAPRCVLRMLEGVEKARKILSADKEATINVDFLLEEEDLLRSLKRDEMEEIIAPIIEKF
jgi:molecular chaperone DnaK (HSP70)